MADFIAVDEIQSYIDEKSELTNSLMWIHDLCTFGSKGYVYNNPDILTKLLPNPYIYEGELSSSLFSEACKASNLNIGKLFKGLANSDNTSFDNLSTPEQLFSNETATSIILNSERAFQMVLDTSLYLSAFCKSQTAVTLLISNSDAFSLFSNNPSAVVSAFKITNFVDILLSSEDIVNIIDLTPTLLNGIYSDSYALHKIVTTPSLYKLGLHCMDYTEQLTNSLNNTEYWLKTSVGTVGGYDGKNDITDFNGFVYCTDASYNISTKGVTLTLKHGYTNNLINYVNEKGSGSTRGVIVKVYKYAFRCVIGLGGYSDPDGENSYSKSISGVIKYTAK